MEKIKLIEHVAFLCPDCKTSIKFEVPNPVKDTDENMDKLSNSVNALTCPKCGTSLGIGASKMLHFVKSYNASSVSLNIGIQNGTIEID